MTAELPDYQISTLVFSVSSKCSYVSDIPSNEKKIKYLSYSVSQNGTLTQMEYLKIIENTAIE